MTMASLFKQLPILEMPGKRSSPSKPLRNDRHNVEDGGGTNNSTQSGVSTNIRSRVKGRNSPTESSGSDDDKNDRLPLLRSASDSERNSGTADANVKAGRMSSFLPWVKLLALATVLTHVCYNTGGFFLETAYFPAHGYMFPGGLKSLTYTPTFDYVASPQQPAAVHIPRIVHVTYKSREELPPEWQQSIEEWEKVHPDWELRFWSDNDIYEFVHNEYPELEALHKSYKYMIQRVDSVRYMILNKFGGVYSDMDIFPATTLDKLLQQWEDAGKDVLLAETSNLGVTNAFMASAPQSRFMQCVLKNMPHYQHAFHHWIHWQHWEILSSAGSTFLWGMVGHCNKDNNQVQIMAADSFRGCSVCKGEKPCDTEWLHHSSTNSSWHVRTNIYHSLMFFITYSYLCHPFRADLVTVTILLVLLRKTKKLRRVFSSK